MASTSIVFFIALGIALFDGCLATPTLRILGGEEASATDFPYIVSVRRNNAHVCGGSIIGINFILTAAHCVSQLGTTPVDPSEITARVGSKNLFAGGKLVFVKEIHIHSSYGSFLNDVAVLKLQYDLVLGPKVKIIELAETTAELVPGSSVAIGGWGRNSSDGGNVYKLNLGVATVISATDCEESIGYGYQSTICLKNKSGAGSCNGDAGGPAVFDNKLVGVSNFVIGTCGTKFPDVYARVSHFHSWIMSITSPQ